MHRGGAVHVLICDGHAAGKLNLCLLGSPVSWRTFMQLGS